MEVNQQPNPLTRKAKIGKQLRIMDRSQLIHGLDLYHH